MNGQIIRWIFLETQNLAAMQSFQSFWIMLVTELSQSIDTFASATLKELDYINEASNQSKCKVEKYSL